MALAGDSDDRPFEDGRCLERRLAEPCQPIVAGNPQIDWHNPLANQTVSQVSRHVGFTFARMEIAASGLNCQCQSSAQHAHPLPFQGSKLAPQITKRVTFSPSARTSAPSQVSCAALVMTQFHHHLVRVVVPGPFLELEAQAGKLLLKDAATLDNVSDNPTRGSIDEQQDRACGRNQDFGPGRLRR